MKTKNILLTTTFLLLSLVVLPADKYVVAKIIMNNNDTVVNLLKYTKLHELQEKIELKVNDSITNIILPIESKGFFTIASKGDTVTFESNCGIEFGLADNLESNCYFLMKVNSGIVPLYYFSKKKLMTMGVSMQIVYQPVYLAKYRDEWTVMEENNYVNQIEKLIKRFKRNAQPNRLKMIKDLESDLIYSKYKFDDLPRFFQQLNEVLK